LLCSFNGRFFPQLESLESDYQTEVSDKNSQIEGLKKALSVSQKEAEELRLQLTSLEEEKSNLQQSSGSISSLQAEIEKSRQEIENLQSKYEEESREKDKQIEDYKAQLLAISSKVADQEEAHGETSQSEKGTSFSIFI